MPACCPTPLTERLLLDSFSGSLSVFPSLCYLTYAQVWKADRLQVLRNCTNYVFLTQNLPCHSLSYDVPHIEFRPSLKAIAFLGISTTLL